MKRDIKLNMSNLRLILGKVNLYRAELLRIETASKKFLTIIRNQDSSAYEKLSGQWEEKVAETERDLKEKLEILSEILNNYISDMEAYITPENPGIPMRVDRNDIWWNYIRISQQVKDMGSILWDTGSSFEDYHRFFVYNIFEDEEENNRRRESMEEEENAERRRRESNYAQLSNFRGALKGAITGSMDDSVLAIRDIHNNHVIPFENTDDHYKNRLDFYYKMWSSVGDKFADLGNLTKDIACGAVDAVIDFAVGTLGLLAGVVELTVWTMLPRDFLQHFGLMPEWLEEDIGKMESTVEMLLTDPGNALETMAQSLSDTADEKGMAYSVSYAVVDMVALDKLLGKLGKLGKVEDVAGTATTMEKMTDAADVGKSLDAAGDVTETAVKSSIEVVKDHVDEMGEVVIKEGTDVIDNHVDDVVSSFEGGKYSGEEWYNYFVDAYGKENVQGTFFNEIKYEPTSGVNFTPTKGKTTTILGRYDMDTQYIFEETGNIKSLSYDGHEGGFNLLNVPDELSNVPGGDFWNDYNVPFLDEAIGRNDVFSLATEPNQASMYRINKDTGLLELSGFGKEIKYLESKGYVFDKDLMQMVPEQ